MMDQSMLNEEHNLQRLAAAIYLSRNTGHSTEMFTYATAIEKALEIREHQLDRLKPIVEELEEEFKVAQEESEAEARELQEKIESGANVGETAEMVTETEM